MEEQERERRRQVVEKFQKAPFEEIAAHCGARVQNNICLFYPCYFIIHLLKFCTVVSCNIFYHPPGHTTAEQTQSNL